MMDNVVTIGWVTRLASLDTGLIHLPHLSSPYCEPALSWGAAKCAYRGEDGNLRSVAQCSAIPTRVGSAFEEPLLTIDAYHAGVAHVIVPVGDHLHRLTAALQLPHGFVGNTSFKGHISRLRTPGPSHEPPWSFDGLLSIATKVDDASNQRDVGLLLPLATHRPEREIRFSLSHKQRRDQGVERAFAGFQPVGVIVLERKERARFCRMTPVSPPTTALPKVINGLYQRYNHSVAVGSTEVTGVAIGNAPRMCMLVGYASRHFGDIESVLPIDQAAPFIGILFADQFLDGNGDERRIGQPLVSVRKRYLHRFRDMMIIVGRAISPGGNIITCDKIENLQSGKSLGVGRQLADLVPTVIRLDGLDPFCLKGAKVSSPQR